jgi:hypothetical protein
VNWFTNSDFVLDENTDQNQVKLRFEPERRTLREQAQAMANYNCPYSPDIEDDVPMLELYSKRGKLGCLYGKGKYMSDETPSKAMSNEVLPSDSVWFCHRNNSAVEKKSTPANEPYVHVLDAFRDMKTHYRDPLMHGGGADSFACVVGVSIRRFQDAALHPA